MVRQLVYMTSIQTWNIIIQVYKVHVYRLCCYLLYGAVSEPKGVLPQPELFVRSESDVHVYGFCFHCLVTVNHNYPSALMLCYFLQLSNSRAKCLSL